MIAETLISDIIVPLKTSDTGEDALGMMNDFYLRHLPIVNDKQLLGLLSEDDILDHDVLEPVGSYQLSLTQIRVNKRDHIYEIMRLLAENRLTIIPVIDDQQNYVGLITLEDVLSQFAQSGSFAEPGCILVLEVGKRDYSLSEIARIVESENAAILSSFIISSLESPRVDVTLKINRQNIQPIIAAFERYDYQIKASFNEAEYVDSLKDRYDALIAYLNV
jgi:predicted transcriptional regulator